MVEMEVKDAMAKTPAASVKPHRQGDRNEGEIQAEPKEKGEIQG